MTGTIQETIDELRRTLTDYIEATYHIGHPILVEQRKRILSEVGGIFQRPYLKSTPRYVTSETYENMIELPSAAREAFIALSNASDGNQVLFNPPYIHQAQALIQTLVHHKNIMIMTGTGSGKTNRFYCRYLENLRSKLGITRRNFVNTPRLGLLCSTR